MTKLLTVDWDYFFPVPHPMTNEGLVLYDWSTREAEFYITTVWPSRAAAFVRNGLDLPQADGYDGWWDQFKISNDAVLYMGESHLFAMLDYVRADVDEVWNFDAHHDAGYHGNRSRDLARHNQDWQCDNWTLWYRTQAGIPSNKLHVRYPTWKHWAMEWEPDPPYKIDRQIVSPDNMPDCEFDRIYVCRSGTWVPPWCDHDLVAFIESAPVETCLYATTTADFLPDEPRDFDLDEVKAEAELWEKLMSMHLTKQGEQQ